MRWHVKLIVAVALSLAQSLMPGMHRLMAGVQHAKADSDSPLSVVFSPDGLTLTWTLARDDRLAELPLRWPLADGRALPYAAWLIALPAGAGIPSVMVEIRRVETMLRSQLDLPAADETPFLPSLPAGWPVHVEEAGVMRGVRLGRALFFPARPTANGWEVVIALQASVRWPAPLGAQALPRATPSDPLLRTIASHVVNPAAIGDVPPTADRQSSLAASRPFLLVDVARRGLVSINRAMLEAAGFVVGSPHTLRLKQAGQDVAMLWEGDMDAEFEPDERLLFYAQPRFSRYADHDTWVLEDAGEPVPRMPTRSAVPDGLPDGTLRTTFLFEQNLLYTPDCGCRPPLNRDGDRWVWTNVQRGRTWSQVLTLPAALAGPAVLTLWLIGYTEAPQSPDHRVQVWLNGGLIGEVTWDGRQALTTTFTFDLDAPEPGAQVPTVLPLALTLPGLPEVMSEGMWVDAVAVTVGTDGSGAIGHSPLQGESVPRAYRLRDSVAYLLDVTTPNQPVRLSHWELSADGVRFGDPLTDLPRTYAAFTETVAPLRVRKPATLDAAQGDFHIITHPDLQVALSSLIARRRSQGFAVVVQTTQAIYDHYGDGRMDPLAIRAYLAAHYHHAAVRPAYVLLVGDGTLDPKRYRAASPMTLLPPLLAEVDPFLGETAADNRFATLDGNDNLPDIAVGRWPVNTPAEAQQLVSKTLSYEDALLMPAARYATFIADNADSAGNFPAKANLLAGVVPAAYFTVTAAMMTPLALTDTRATLLNHWNSSRVVVFLGHASPRQWAAERLFHRDDVATLPVSVAPPVVVGLACYTARFHELQDTLDETLVRAAGRGAVATWGATGLTLSSGHDALGQGFMRAWLDGSWAGDAALAGKLALAAGGLYLDLLDTYTLLGDPKLMPNRRWATHAVYLPTLVR